MGGERGPLPPLDLHPRPLPVAPPLTHLQLHRHRPVIADAVQVLHQLGRVLLVELHLGVGLYRILVKWTAFNREMGSAIKWALTGVFVVLGYWILWTFWTVGLAHLQ